MSALNYQRFAILLSCSKKAFTVAAVGRAFNIWQPDAQVDVFDHNSTNGTVAEVLAVCKSHAEGLASKFNTYRDGIRVLWMIVKLYKNVNPLQFLAAGLAASVVLAVLLLETSLQTGLVPRPTGSLCMGLMGVVLFCVLVLDTVTQGRVEQKRFTNLPMPALRRDACEACHAYGIRAVA